MKRKESESWDGYYSEKFILGGEKIRRVVKGNFLMWQASSVDCNVWKTVMVYDEYERIYNAFILSEKRENKLERILNGKIS